ncbi:hypothetical protein SAMN02927937_01591 [Paenimyroides aquimaris]|uniref:Uncharacterized protein n=1 Tax=Paenimyroides marinum TaxID=1159016 RepID=A0A1H6LB92_9FLAO|nr:hypothetical protein [Paenimyroides aquimaris]SEH81825.1 hypothetical protein SAMN02927937_01591 [Paenimyroides aquimaris]
MKIIQNIKKVTLGILGIIMLSSGLWACSNDNEIATPTKEEQSNKAGKAIEKSEVIRDAIQNSKLHSLALDYAYTNLLNGNLNEQTPLNDIVSSAAGTIKQYTEKDVNIDLVKEYLNVHCNNIENVFNQIEDVNDSTKDINYIVNEISYLNSLQDNIIDLDITSYLESDKFNGFTEKEFYNIAYIVTIYVDSYKYWSINSEKWQLLVAPSTIQAKGGPIGRRIAFLANADSAGATGVMVGALLTAATGVGAPVTAGELLTGAAASSIVAGLSPEYWSIR